MILQHPLFDRILHGRERLPERFQQAQFRLHDEDLDLRQKVLRDYRDPLAADREGAAYDKHWLAGMEPVSVRDSNVGWWVIVQESYDTAIGTTLAKLRSKLLGYGLAALAMVVLVLVSLWSLAFRLLGETGLLRVAGVPNWGSERLRQPLTQRGPTETQGGPGVRELDKSGPDKQG
jgi:hypothetical protein